MQQFIEQFSETIRKAAAERMQLRIRGGGTKDFYGLALIGDVLDTRACAGIVDYDPTELVLTARAGTPLSEVESVLAKSGQMLAFEPPHFGGGATLGGCIAAGLSGPRRPYAGSARDFVLGLRMLDGRGTDLRFGGQVMKNVAGYDVSRLVTGSLGTLSEARSRSCNSAAVSFTRRRVCRGAKAPVNTFRGTSPNKPTAALTRLPGSSPAPGRKSLRLSCRSSSRKR